MFHPIANLYSQSFLGATDADEEGTWIWDLDGSEIGAGFNAWGEGQPMGGRDENCLVMLVDGTWHDYPCEFDADEDPIPFVCEIDNSELELLMRRVLQGKLN